MHPALSIIVFTTFTGIGYGLAAVLGVGGLAGAGRATPIAYAVALILIVLGLLSSTGHLHHPERAWRALGQWRSSWLSREGVVALVAFLPLAVAGGAAILLERHLAPAGWIAAILCAATVFCTSMIYASLKTINAWHTVLTPLAFLAFAAAGGLIAANAVLAFTGELQRLMPALALLALVVAGAVKAMWWIRAARARPVSTPETATGLGRFGAVRLLERPHVNENYLTREMGHRIARKHADKLRAIAVLLAALVPAVCLLLALVWPGFGLFRGLLVAAAPVHLAGMLLERWLFFAEARHTVMLYYNERA